MTVLFADVVHSMDIAAAVGAERLREIMMKLADRPAGALRHEIADEAVRVHAVGGAQISHAEHGLARQPPRGGQHGRVGRLEGGALREGVPRVAVRHAQELGAT